MRLVGKGGIEAISRLMGFLLVCMGVQFIINGIRKSLKRIIKRPEWAFQLLRLFFECHWPAAKMMIDHINAAKAGTAPT